MASLLIALIYVAFISLGLPDSLLGAAWPVVRLEFGAELSGAGVIAMIISGGTIVSSLLSDRMNRRFGTGMVTAVSVLMTAVALFGFSLTKSVLAMCVLAIPYGLGAGGVDAALNNYVAIHYSARHMSWLHCFWGLGASISPYIMSVCLNSQVGWRGGYVTVSVIQLVLALAFFATLFVWKQNQSFDPQIEDEKPVGVIGALKIKGVPYVLIAFLCYCTIEATTGLWISSYYVEHKGITPEVAAGYASAFYLGLTGGRFIIGFIADRVGDKNLIRVGMSVVCAGIAMIMIPVDGCTLSRVGLLVTGLGCAPVYPSIIHATPINFGKVNSQAIVGIQMASAYVGCTFMPPVFGMVANYIDISLFPYFLMLFAVMTIVMTELLNNEMAKKQKAHL